MPGVLALGSCVLMLPAAFTTAGDGKSPDYAVPVSATDGSATQLTDRQRRIVAAAHSVLGRTTLVVRGRSFLYDCTGTILAIYYQAGIDLLPYFNRVSGNGVMRLYKIGQQSNLLYTTRYPQPGDVIFWDNTYDMNGDGKWDDPLTHAGVVVDVRPDGTIDYVHQNYAQGIVIEQMNLLHPAEYRQVENGREVVINSPLRMRSDVYMNPGMIFSGQLFRCFAQLYRLR
ncbi:MAG TPA: CHAP domain-containing protein [Spirochaetia bacterium]|nr:CHAP domain-containing protein [Spirochaetia bacterium]